MTLLTALTPSPRYNRPIPANNGLGFCGSGPDIKESPGLAFLHDLLGTVDKGDWVEGRGKEECRHGWGVGGIGLTPDQTGERLDDPTVSLTRERTLLDFGLHPK